MAREAFEESLEQNPNEAGALFGLSWISSEMGDHPYAIKTVTRLIGLKSGQEGDRGKYLAFAYYNRASFRLPAAPSDPVEHGKATADVEHSAKLSKEKGKAKEWKETFSHDLEVGEDLHALWSAHAKKLQALLDSMD